MKRIIAAVLIVMIGLAAFSAPRGSVSANSGSADRIYDKTSTGAMVVRIQMRLRELGYLNFKPTGSYRSMTVNAVKDFQVNYRDSGYGMQVDGKMGPQSLDLLFSHAAMRSSLGGVSIPSGPKHGASTLAKTGDLVPWQEVKSLLEVGRTYSFTDCYTGNAFELKFAGGENHAEMEAPSSEKLDDFKAICGKEYNYLKRPVVIEIAGRQIAASVQCWPHGSDTDGPNGMDGHVCVFFDGCISGVGSLPDVEHTENVYKAAGK